MANKVRVYSGESIDVTYDGMRCIHAAECVRGLPEVFDTSKRPWVQPGNAPADVVAEIVLRCPTGALHFVRKDGGAEETTAERNLIVPDFDGPLFVRGDVRLVTAEDELILEDTRVALCRCGHSAAKPFCDGSHHRVGFVEPGLVEVEGDQEGGPHTTLEIKVSNNGPLRVKGGFELRSADGETSYQGTRTALCRCGGSGNKPFCDGTHRRIGFQG